MATSKILWVNDLSGTVNQMTASHFMSSNQFKLLNNIDQSEIGALAHRLGTERYLNLVSGTGEVKGLHMYEKADGNYYFHMVEAGNLRRADQSGGTWTLQEGSVWASTSDVDMVNFINRHYMIGEGATEYLRYATNSGATSVVSGNITGKYLASNGTYLMVVDPASRRAKWSGVAADTFAADDYTNINGIATGIGEFGMGRPFIVFTNEGFLFADPANVYFSEVAGFGCVSHRSIQTIRGHIIYLGREGLYMLSYNDSFPVEISRPIRNEWSKNAIFNKISASNMAVSASGVIDNRYFLALRDLSGTVKGEDLDSVVLEYDIAQETLKSHTFETGGIGSVMGRFVNSSGELALYAGSHDDKAVYKLLVEDTYTDDNSSAEAQDVTAKVITKDYEFYDATKALVVMQNVARIHFKYVADAELTVKYSLDGNQTYTELPVTLEATDSGYDFGRADVPFGKECKSISLDISGTDRFAIYGIGFEVVPLPTTGIKLR